MPGMFEDQHEGQCGKSTAKRRPRGERFGEWPGFRAL